jgi:hypothetical protein
MTMVIFIFLSCVLTLVSCHCGQVFEPFGPVELVQLPSDIETGQSKGFGFVQVGLSLSHLFNCAYHLFLPVVQQYLASCHYMIF